MPAMPQPFYLGLNMSGTVSAGAYTAGVIDFLVEAMDAWYAERGRQIQQFGGDFTIRYDFKPEEGCNNDTLLLGTKFDILAGGKTRLKGVKV